MRHLARTARATRITAFLTLAFFASTQIASAAPLARTTLRNGQAAEQPDAKGGLEETLHRAGQLVTAWLTPPVPTPTARPASPVPATGLEEKERSLPPIAVVPNVPSRDSRLLSVSDGFEVLKQLLAQGPRKVEAWQDRTFSGLWKSPTVRLNAGTIEFRAEREWEPFRADQFVSVVVNTKGQLFFDDLPNNHLPTISAERLLSPTGLEEGWRKVDTTTSVAAFTFGGLLRERPEGVTYRIAFVDHAERRLVIQEGTRWEGYRTDSRPLWKTPAALKGWQLQPFVPRQEAVWKDLKDYLDVMESFHREAVARNHVLRQLVEATRQWRGLLRNPPHGSAVGLARRWERLARRAWTTSVKAPDVLNLTYARDLADVAIALRSAAAKSAGLEENQATARVKAEVIEMTELWTRTRAVVPAPKLPNDWNGALFFHTPPGSTLDLFHYVPLAVAAKIPVIVVAPAKIAASVDEIPPLSAKGQALAGLLADLPDSEGLYHIVATPREAAEVIASHYDAREVKEVEGEADLLWSFGLPLDGAFPNAVETAVERTREFLAARAGLESGA